MIYLTKLVHISSIVAGDTIMCVDGKVRTVCGNNIRKCSFMGISIFGDNYKSGTEKVKKLIILRAVKTWKM